MKISRKDVQVRKVDESLRIAPIFDGREFKFDIALGMLHGSHGLLINHVSDRVLLHSSRIVQGHGRIADPARRG